MHKTGNPFGKKGRHPTSEKSNDGISLGATAKAKGLELARKKKGDACTRPDTARRQRERPGGRETSNLLLFVRPLPLDLGDRYTQAEVKGEVRGK